LELDPLADQINAQLYNNRALMAVKVGFCYLSSLA